MAQVKYTVLQVPENTVTGNENFRSDDLLLVDNFQINSTFISNLHTIEYHVFELDGTPIYSDYDYRNYALLQNNQSAGRNGSSTLTLDPVRDIESYGLGGQDVVVLYNFLNDLFTVNRENKEFFIRDISKDRTELRILPVEPGTDLAPFVTSIQEKIQSTSYFSEFRLNFNNNDLFIGININLESFEGEQAILVKLYEPLPERYDTNSLFTVVEVVSDPITFDIRAEILPEEVKYPNLRSPNFNIEIDQEVLSPSQFYNINELFSYPVTSSYNQITSLFSEKSIEVNIDYSSYGSFVNFSSAEERLLNFKYKLTQLVNAEAELQSINTFGLANTGYTGSREVLETTINNILSNFDHYDRHLYYESGSTSWPKTNNTRPYLLSHPTSSEAVSWFVSQQEEAIGFDESNGNALVNTIPAFLRDDPNNSPYLTFIYMIGQHFDNIWIYSKAVTDKYNADNRITVGISKDLIQDALKNFGVKLYTGNKSLENLFKVFTGELYELTEEEFGDRLGSAQLISASNQPISEDLYRKEVYKRIYHNLPLITKAKGTERGLRALINSFGIPTSGSNALKIQTRGGINTEENLFYSPVSTYSSSLDKIRLDNTGSFISKVEKSTTTQDSTLLSNFTSVVKRDTKYSSDIHSVTVGYSPQDNVDSYIISQSNVLGITTFNIDDYIGDPRYMYESTYSTLIAQSNYILGDLDRYDLNDYVRLLKFYDNVIFKMVKDYVPGRSDISTGVIIKPHLLERSKIKQVQIVSKDGENLSGSYSTSDTGSFSLVKKQQVGDIVLTGSISILEVSGSHGGSFRYGGNDFTASAEFSASYIETVNTPFGLAPNEYHNHEEAKFDGEFSGSFITLTTGELNDENLFKYDNSGTVKYTLLFISSSDNALPTTPINTPTNTPTQTPPTPTPTNTNTPTNTPLDSTPTNTPTNTPTSTPTNTNTPTNTPTVNYYIIERCESVVNPQRAVAITGITFTVGDSSTGTGLSIFGNAYFVAGTATQQQYIDTIDGNSSYDLDTVPYTETGIGCLVVATPTNTPTNTPTATPPFYSYIVTYGENSDLEACAATGSFTVYSLCSPIVQGGGCKLYNTWNENDPVAIGFYADTVNGNYYSVENINGTVEEVGVCAGPPATPTATPPLDCNPISASYGQATTASICTQPNNILIYYQGVNPSLPTVGETAYTGDTCDGKFVPTGFYNLATAGYYIEVQANGYIGQVVECIA